MWETLSGFGHTLIVTGTEQFSALALKAVIDGITVGKPAFLLCVSEQDHTCRNEVAKKKKKLFKGTKSFEWHLQ